MVVVINVDVYPFLVFSDLTCRLEDTGMCVSGYTVMLDSKDTKLGSGDQEASPSAGKNTRVVLVPCCTKCVPQLFRVVQIFPRSLGVICCYRMNFQ